MLFISQENHIAAKHFLLAKHRIEKHKPLFVNETELRSYKVSIFWEIIKTNTNNCNKENVKYQNDFK